MTWTPPVALTIAGSDSGGGAGIQADLRTFAAFAVHGCAAVAALTAQNTTEVRGVVATDPAFLRLQVEAVLDDLPVRAVKTGMLATAANVEVVAALAAEGRLPNLVVDPVMVASSGARLLDPDAEDAYRELLVPRATVVTPNGREAAVLVGGPVASPDDQTRAAEALAGLGAQLAVVTGGDGIADEAVDVAWWAGGGDVVAELRSPRVETVNTHGTGCSFAAAVAAGLARGDDPARAVVQAKDFVSAAVAGAARWELGAGHGPIDHLGWAAAIADGRIPGAHP